MSLDSEKFQKVIGSQIRYARKNRDVSKESLANMVHCSEGHIANIESGNKGMSLDLFVEIVNSLDIAPDIVLNEFLVNHRSYHNACIYEIFNDCDDNEINFLIEMLKSTKLHMRMLSYSGNHDPQSGKT